MKFPGIVSALVALGAALLTGCGGGSHQSGGTPDFALSIRSSQAWSGGNAGSAAIVVSVKSLAGFSGTVALSTTNLPNGITGSFSPASVDASGNSTLTLTSTNGKPADGNYPFTITGTSGNLTNSSNAALFVPGPVKMESIIPPGAMEGSDGAAIQTYIMSNAVVTGPTFQVEWSAIDSDGNPAHYSWSYIDSLIQAWTSPPVSKKANIIFWANSDSATTTCAGNSWSQFGEDGTGNCAIPTYVWNALGSSNYVTCTPSNANGPQRIPNYFDAAFQTNYQTFIRAAIAHFASNASIGYIRFGLGRGGETLPVGDWDSGDACSQQFTAWGLTDSTITTKWEPYLQTMLNFEAQNNPSGVQLMVGITPVGSAGVPDFVANTAVPLKTGFGSQGFQKSDMTNPPNSCNADWCNLFNTYTGQVPLELQTVGQSNSCTAGSLVNLLPFAVNNKVTILEIFYEDWLTAFDPNYSPYDGTGAYASALTSAATGQ